MEKPPNVLQRPGTRPSRAASAAGFLRRTLALGLLACVVASLGLTAGSGAEPERPRSFSEQALNEAFATSRVLAARAESLAGSLDAGAAAELRSAADILNQQSLLLASPGSAAAARNPAAAPTRPYARALLESARRNLAAAGRADYGTARLLAAAGTGQLLLAERTAQVLGEPLEQLPESGWTPVLQEQPKCSGDDRAVLRDRPGAAESLHAAVNAEYGAAYGYEVAQAQVGSGFTVLGQPPAQRRNAHLEAGQEGVRLLPDLCLPEVTPLPAWSLDPAFLAEPVPSLEELEGMMPSIYADLAGNSDGAVRSWAIDRLVATSLLLYSTGEIPPAPGLDAEPAHLPWAAG
ncbi:DUF4439 domain-containing protein [Arthrobacter gandavensis]|uniref:DUF4439 domain-containing protein n=1 Tax=Arthrobacter gandavensis TaxID=169960 RepID=UPI00188F59B8|nr:DUF4439 domain-containing protein [Arthrobacter gandavensis]MBF4992846.1 DUF4439 domain-containing protein [Arthrobacter gandavensis]